MSQKKFLTTKDVCNRYGRSGRSVDRWVESGVLPKPIYINGQRYWDEADLDERDEARKAVMVAA